MTRRCQVHQLHLVTYENGLAMQESLVKRRQAEAIDDQFLLLEHPPVITLGRGGDQANLLADDAMLRRAGVRFYETTRGGDITYHGPGQVVGYPILHLGEGNRDVRKYVTKLEEVLIRTAADYGVTATREEGKRGIWVGRNKLAAIGVRIARWVTSHGFAFNVAPNLDHFRLITPCGLQGTGVTSLEKLTGRGPDQAEFRSRVLRHFGEVYDRELVEPEPPLRIAKVIIHDGEGRVLLLHRRDRDFWQPVTGAVELGESVMETARRETAEETGFDLEIADLGIRQSFLVDDRFVDESSFIARANGSGVVRMDAEEHDRFSWFTLDEALQRIHWTDDRESLERAAALLSAPTYA